MTQRKPRCRPALVALLACAALLGTAATAPAGDKPAKVNKVSVEEFDKLRSEKDVVLLDVRTPEEFEAGHLPGAMNLPIADEEFDEKLADLDKDKTYLVHCAKGVRSERACRKMSKLDFKALYDLAGGLEAWKNAGKPVEKGATEGKRKK